MEPKIQNPEENVCLSVCFLAVAQGLTGQRGIAPGGVRGKISSAYQQNKRD